MATEYMKIHDEHCYKGVWYSNEVVDASLDRLPDFEVRPDDIWIVTYPKSGTHWMLEIVGLIKTGGYPEKIDRSLSTSCVEFINMDQRFPTSAEEEKEHPVDMSPFLDIVEKAPSPRVMETHLPIHLLPRDMVKKAKVIYVARNPKDVVVSYQKFVGHNPTLPISLDQAIKNIMNDRMHWGPWFEHVHEFWKLRDHENVFFVSYEDLLQDSGKYIRQIAEFLGRPLTEEVLQRVVEQSNIKSMKKTYKKLEESGKGTTAAAEGAYPYLRKGGCGQWKNLFTVAQNEAFDEWYQKKTAGTDLKVTFEL